MSEQQAKYKTKAGRKSGYYWIKTGYSDNNEWEIGLYNQELNSWFVAGDSQHWVPQKINETRIQNPDEL